LRKADLLFKEFFFLIFSCPDIVNFLGKKQVTQAKNLYMIECLKQSALPVCQGGGAATQSPAERFHSGSNPDLGFYYLFGLM
jgi:hypothetical protein